MDNGGSEFAYLRPGADGNLTLVIRREPWLLFPGMVRETEVPIRLGVLEAFTPAQTANTAYVLIQGTWHGQLLKFSKQQKAFQTIVPGLSGIYLTFSPDGKWMVYVDDNQSLWRSRADGSNAVQLSKGFQYAQLASWSPDGSKIAFMGMKPGRPWRIFVVDRDGGAAKEAALGEDNQGAPTWSPDGNKLVYGNVMCNETQTCWIRLIDLKTGRSRSCRILMISEQHGGRQTENTLQP